MKRYDDDHYEDLWECQTMEEYEEHIKQIDEEDRISYSEFEARKLRSLEDAYLDCLDVAEEYA